MADYVVNFLVQYLSQQLEKEGSFFGGVEGQVKSLHRELRLINIFLENSRGKRNEHPIVKEVVRQVREVAYEAEDVIDMFILKVAEHRRRSSIGRIVHFPTHAMMLRDVAKKIAGIKNEINEIYNNREKYNIERATETVDAAEALHRRRREVEEDDVVGFVDDSSTLVKQLIEGDRNRDIISVIGMGGLGKTTLARKIYNNVRIKSHFECRAWVYVSQDFRIKELLLNIFKQFEISYIWRTLEEIMGMEISDLWTILEGMGVKELKEKLFTCLGRKRYLIVMDDIWKTEVWDEVRSAFPDDLNASRILITSRIKEVASHASLTPPYFLPFLNKNESWELLSKNVFRGGACPPELETMGRKIADDCRGLPLSIVVLGGLLASKEKTPEKWSTLIGNVNWHLIETNTICKDILALSYTNLPRRLQPCFLYFGVYPEDFEIPGRQLIHLWTAEGFIQHAGNRSIEDVAEDYLEELIDRSLIQVARRRTDGGVRKCRIHDLLRDLCISESKADNFLVLLKNDIFEDHSFLNKSRRVSVHGNYSLNVFQDFSDPLLKKISNFSDPTCARSLLFFGYYKNRDWNLCVKNFKLIRVLNFECITLHSFPKSIKTMMHLRYLSIRLSYTVRNIPDSIRNLTNLETLFIMGDTGQCYSVTGIFKLPRLRNLHLKGFKPLSCHLDEVLWNLQVLSFEISSYNGKEQTFPFAPDMLPCLRELRILGDDSLVGKRNAVDFLKGLHHLGNLQILRIKQFPKLPSGSSLFPSTISKLTIQNVMCFGGVGTMSMLGNLPNLRILKIKTCFGISDMHVSGNSFLRLEVLQLQYLLGFNEWKQDGSAMPCLRYLVIRRCDFLTMLPPELWSLIHLQKVEVEVKNPNSILRRMLQELQMNVRCKIVTETKFAEE